MRRHASKASGERVSAEDFYAAANEKRDEEEIEEMGQTDPERKPELDCVGHNANDGCLI